MTLASFLPTYIILCLCAFPLAYYYWRVLGIEGGYWRTLLIYGCWHCILQVYNASEPWLSQNLRADVLMASNVACMLLGLAVELVLVKLISHAKWRRCLFAFTVMYVLIAVGSGIGRACGAFMMSSPSLTEAGVWMVEALFSTAVISLIQAILLFFAAELMSRFLRTHPVDVRWSAFSAVLAAQAAGIGLIGVLTVFRYQNGLEAYAVLTVFTVICALADIYLALAFRETVRSAELQQRLLMYRQQQELWQVQYQNVSEQLSQIRRIRHDYANTLQTIGGLLLDGHTAEAGALATATRRALSEQISHYTGHPVVDTVLYNKYAQAEKKGIRMELQLLLPATLPIEDADLISVFTNLLDNAIEYCETLPEDTERCIRLSAGVQGCVLVLRISNTYLGESSPLDDPQTTKKDAWLHGFGVSFARAVAEANHGDLTSSVADGMLHVTLMLRLPETSAI